MRLNAELDKPDLSQDLRRESAVAESKRTTAMRFYRLLKSIENVFFPDQVISI